MSQVPKCADDYEQWQITMYSTFGTKWSKLHRGPMWSVVPIGQTSTLAEEGTTGTLTASDHDSHSRVKY